jgi:methylated-DNA-[protein]-cysteine S-methyltransferase
MRLNEKVLNLVKTIPKSKVTTYKEIAKKLNTKAYRAVGNALKHNEKPIIIPCHRVINSDGTVGGYKGIKNSREKIRLLKKEGIKIKYKRIENLKDYLFLFR